MSLLCGCVYQSCQKFSNVRISLYTFLNSDGIMEGKNLFDYRGKMEQRPRTPDNSINELQMPAFFEK